MPGLSGTLAGICPFLRELSDCYHKEHIVMACRQDWFHTVRLGWADVGSFSENLAY
jgi:hypothetical protein